MTEHPDDVAALIALLNDDSEHAKYPSLHVLKDAAAALVQLRDENAAIRTLMNTYNLGGWTDSISVLQRAERAEAERDDAISIIRAMNEEMILAGYSRGDRNVTLANIRMMKNDLAHERACMDAWMQKLRNAESDLAACRADRDSHQRVCMEVIAERDRISALLQECMVSDQHHVAERDQLRRDAERLDFLLAITTAEGAAEDDPRCVAMALAFAQGLDGRAAIDRAIAASGTGEKP